MAFLMAALQLLVVAVSARAASLVSTESWRAAPTLLRSNV